jgi:hypothetical protein
MVAEVFEDPEEELDPAYCSKLYVSRAAKGHDTCSKYCCFRGLACIVFSSRRKGDNLGRAGFLALQA